MKATREILDVELDLFTATVDVGVSRANCGDVTGGHDELLHGLERAEAARDHGGSWGAERVGHRQRALERVAEGRRSGGA